MLKCKSINFREEKSADEVLLLIVEFNTRAANALLFCFAVNVNRVRVLSLLLGSAVGHSSFVGGNRLFSTLLLRV